MLHDKMIPAAPRLLFKEARKKGNSMRLQHVLGDAKLVIREGTTLLKEEHRAGERTQKRPVIRKTSTAEVLKAGPPNQASASSGDFSEMPIPRAHPRPTKSVF